MFGGIKSSKKEKKLQVRSKKQENRVTFLRMLKYDAAKDEQRDIEARIEEIEKILKNAEVVVEDEVDLDKINVGWKVKVQRL